MNLTVLRRPEGTKQIKGYDGLTDKTTYLRWRANMTQSLSQILVHIIFSTKNREPLLPNQQVCQMVHAYIAGICNQMKSPALIVGGVEDHIHILCNQSKNIALKDLVQNIKQDSSKWIKRKWPELSYFYWQQGYAAFSVSPVYVEEVRAYINNQVDHHKKVQFKDELRLFLTKYKVPFNEQYLWD